MKQKGLASILILVIFLIIGINVAVWYSYFKNKAVIPIYPPFSTVSPPAGEALTSPSPDPTVDETALIKQAVFRKTGLNEDNAEVTININIGRHAKGNIKEKETVGGAYWLAAKTSSGWVCVYDGQAHPACSQIAPYDFPRDMVSECLGAGGEVVKR